MYQSIQSRGVGLRRGTGMTGVAESLDISGDPGPPNIIVEII